jgi:hypothetical protein
LKVLEKRGAAGQSPERLSLILSGGFQEVVVIPSGGYSSDIDAGLIRYGFDKIQDCMPDGRHGGWSAVGSEAHKVVMENDIKHPVKVVFDAPMGADSAGELFSAQDGGRQVVSSSDADSSAAFDFGFDHAEGGETWFTGKTPVRG